MKLGTKNVVGLKLGTVNISRAYLGSTLVWDAGGDPEPPPGYRYYRLVMTANNGRDTLNIGELQIRSSIGGADQTGAGTASSGSPFSGANAADFAPSKAFDNNGSTFWASTSLAVATAASSTFTGYPASNAFDGNPATMWSSNSNITAAWLRRDESRDVTSYKIRARAGANNGTPKDWTLEHSSDGTTWVAADTVTGETGWANGEEREYPIASVGYRASWRLNVADTNGRNTINVAEFTLVGNLGVDLTYDFGSGNEMTALEYAITGRSDANNGSPKDWTLEGSNDLESWTVLDTVTGETGWSIGETREYEV